MHELAGEAFATWTKGGWLMLPLFVLTILIYHGTLELLLRLNRNPLIRSRHFGRGEANLEAVLLSDGSALRGLLALEARSPLEARRHFQGIRNEYLSVVSRRIRFLAILISAGPLLGLLGTVTGMLRTFDGMAKDDDSKFASVVSGVSEALITTQAGLIISIPAFVILSFIIARRNTLERRIARLEQFDIRRTIRGNRSLELEEIR